MFRRLPHILVGLAIIAAVITAVLADPSADLKRAVQQAAAKPTAAQQAEIDQTLKGVLANPDALTAAEYAQARMLQAQRLADASPGKKASEKRKVLNEEYLKIVDELDREYASQVGIDNKEYCAAIDAQLEICSAITTSTQAQQAAAKVVDAFLADMAIRTKATPLDQKPAVLKSMLVVVGKMPPGTKQQEVVKAIQEQILAMGTPETKTTYLDRAAAHAANGDNDAALKDLAAALADTQSGEDVKNRARAQRMALLARLERWAEAKADAEVLAAIAPNKYVAGFDPFSSAQVKRDALRIRLTAADITEAVYQDEVVKLFQDVLAAANMPAEHKAIVLTDILMNWSEDAAVRYQWDQALGFARSAYAIAPYDKVPSVVGAIQSLLANKSRKPLTRKLDVKGSPDDVAKAEAFFARQAGVRTVDGKAIKLAGDLSNQDQFPRLLDATPMPYSAQLKALIEEVAAKHRDPLAKALAWGLLNQPDRALDVVADSINSLPPDSASVSTFVNYAARFVRAKFESVALANAFLESQAQGAKKGTPNPLLFAQ